MTFRAKIKVGTAPAIVLELKPDSPNGLDPFDFLAKFAAFINEGAIKGGFTPTIREYQGKIIAREDQKNV